MASSTLCDLFDRAVLYKNEDYLPFQKFAFTNLPVKRERNA